MSRSKTINTFFQLYGDPLSAESFLTALDRHIAIETNTRTNDKYRLYARMINESEETIMSVMRGEIMPTQNICDDVQVSISYIVRNRH